MLNMNRASLLGHAGRDPEIRDLANGEKAATFTLATTEKWKDREGQPAEATEWHRIVVYGPTVAAVETMVRKGDAVLVEGRIATRDYRDREDVARTVTEIVVAGRQGMVNVLSAPARGRGTGSGVARMSHRFALPGGARAVWPSCGPARRLGAVLHRAVRQPDLGRVLGMSSFPISIGPITIGSATRRAGHARTRPLRSASADRRSRASGSRSACGSRRG